MKNAYKLLGIAALALAIVFSFAACNTGTSSGGGDLTPKTYDGYDGSNTYTLKIWDPGKAAYSPKDGDKYELTVTLLSGGSKKISTGTITVSGSTFTLIAYKGGTATVTVSTAGIENITITATITYEDNSTQPPVEITVTPGKPSGGGDVPITVEATSGELTITGIDAQYNGKYVLYSSSDFYAAADLTGTNQNNRKTTLGKIESGSVKLKIWKMILTSKTSVIYGNYTGNDQNVPFPILIFETQTLTGTGPFYPIMPGVVNGVNFTNGKGTGTFTAYVDISSNIVGQYSDTNPLGGTTFYVFVTTSSWQVAHQGSIYSGRFTSWDGTTATLYSSSLNAVVGTATFTTSNAATIVIDNPAASYQGTYSVTKF